MYAFCYLYSRLTILSTLFTSTTAPFMMMASQLHRAHFASCCSFFTFCTFCV